MAFAKACKILAGQPSPRFLRIAPSSLSTISSRKKSARELRQRRSDYRCCIPALAGFVSPQSIAPDGGKTFVQDRDRATIAREMGMTKLQTITMKHAFRHSDFVIDSLFDVSAPSSALSSIDSISCIWLHRGRELARSLYIARSGMLLHYDRQPA